MQASITAQDLVQAVPNLTGRHAQAAANIASRWQRWGSISEAQESYAKALVDMASGKPQERAKTDLGNFASMVALFDKVSAKLKFPKISLHCEGIGAIELSQAGQKSRNPGTINVATPGGYGNSTWFGRVLATGAFEASPRVECSTSLIALLQAFAAEPARIAAEYGKLTGHCCFCRLPLTDQRSVDQGYGPICAKNYGLPWGN